MRQSCRGAGAEAERESGRRPVAALNMLSAHILHPEYMQPVPATPLSPIELDAKKSPLALLAQTCSQIGKPDLQPSSKLGLGVSGGKESPRPLSCLKLGETAGEDKSSFKPYAKVGDSQKEGVDKAGFRAPGVTGQAFPSPRPPSLPAGPGTSPPPHGDCKAGDLEDKTDVEGKACRQLSPPAPVGSRAGSEHRDTPTKNDGNAGLALGHVAPVSPYKPGHPVYPLPPSSMGYHNSMVGAYTAAYPGQYVSAMEPKPGLVSGQMGGVGKSANSSPLMGASPPSFVHGLCRDPYCLSYHCSPTLGGSGCASCLHEPNALKNGYPLVYPPHPLQSAPGLGTHPLYTYGFMLHSDPRPHVCNWVSAAGPCDKRFSTSDDLLGHLRYHTALPGADKLLAHYASPTSCGLHLPQHSPAVSSGLALRGPHALALGRYHPYGKSQLSAPTNSMITMSAATPYYAPYALYGQQFAASASALGYQ